jgi:hypothetical protein
MPQALNKHTALLLCWFLCCCVCAALQDWWNAATLADYWKLWNVPVHKWMLRTIFFPLVRRGAPRLASLLFVFLVSAVMHELAVGVPLRMLRGWAFWGMMLQVCAWGGGPGSADTRGWWWGFPNAVWLIVWLA